MSITVHCKTEKIALFTERYLMMSIPLNTIRRYLLNIAFNSLENIANRRKFLINICDDSNILRIIFFSVLLLIIRNVTRSNFTNNMKCYIPNNISNLIPQYGNSD